MAETDIILSVRDLHYEVETQAGQLTILDGINLSIKKGESVAIVGASGSGKSTLLGMLAALDVPTRGEIVFDGQAIVGLDEEARANLRRRHVSFVFQNFQLVDNLSALENVALPLEVFGDKNASQSASQFLQRVGLADRAHHRVQQLSGGEQQRVALARAFACSAPIIFADEPTGNLDSETGEKVADLLFELNAEQNTTLVLVTHSEALAKRCRRVMTMRAGRLQEAP